jgi:3-polyprenyl-4-hydroxybenzoate decarboxylase
MHHQNLNQSGLDAWLEKAASENEIKRMSVAVDPQLELATIAWGLKRSPALLFEGIIGHPGHRALINVIGSRGQNADGPSSMGPSDQAKPFVLLRENRLTRAPTYGVSLHNRSDASG